MRIFLIDREYFEKYEHKIKIRYFMLSERRRRLTFEHLSKIFIVLCNTSIDAEAMCDLFYSDYTFLLDSDSTVFDYSNLNCSNVHKCLFKFDLINYYYISILL